MQLNRTKKKRKNIKFYVNLKRIVHYSMQILNLVKLIIIAPRMLTFQAMILKCQSEDFTKDIKPDLITIRCF